jgi:NAD/NADP transhydrogenase alpha subunit
VNTELLAPITTIIGGVVIIIIRGHFGRAMTELLQGTKATEATRAKAGRLFSTGTGVFGVVVVLIGLGIGASRLGLV